MVNYVSTHHPQVNQLGIYCKQLFELCSTSNACNDHCAFVKKYLLRVGDVTKTFLWTWFLSLSFKIIPIVTWHVTLSYMCVYVHLGTKIFTSITKKKRSKCKNNVISSTSDFSSFGVKLHQTLTHAKAWRNYRYRLSVAFDLWPYSIVAVTKTVNRWQQRSVTSMFSLFLDDWIKKDYFYI